MCGGSGGSGSGGRSGGGGSTLNAAIPESREAKIELRNKLKSELDALSYPGSKASEAELDKWRARRTQYLRKIAEVQAQIPRKVVGFTDKEKAALGQMHEEWNGPRKKGGANLFTSEI